MNGFKFEPVAWLTTLCALVIALAGSQELAGILPPTLAGWLYMAAVVAVVILGVIARGRVTPLARPRDADNRRLVPTPPNPLAGPQSTESASGPGSPFVR